MSAEPEGVAERDPYASVLGYVRAVIQIAAVVRVVEIDRWRHHRVCNGSNCGNKLHTTARAQGMPRTTLCTADDQLVGVLAEDLLNGSRFREVTDRRTCTMGVDVVDFRRRDRGIFQRKAHGHSGARPVFHRLGNVVSVRG